MSRTRARTCRFLDSIHDSRELDELEARLFRKESRDGGLATSGRASEQQAGELSLVQCLAERSILSQEVRLSHDLIEGRWTHPCGERCGISAHASRSVSHATERCGVIQE